MRSVIGATVLALTVVVAGATLRGTAAEPAPVQTFDAGPGAKPDSFGVRLVATAKHLAITSQDGGGKVWTYQRTPAGKWESGKTLTSAAQNSPLSYGHFLALDPETLFVGREPATLDALRFNKKWERDGDGVFSPMPLLQRQDYHALQAAAVHGDWAAVGEFPFAVHIYQRQAGGRWKFEQGLRGENWRAIAANAPESRFGVAVALSGDTLLVGDPRTHGDGLAYFYARLANGRWGDGQRMAGKDRKDTDVFGAAVALSGDVAVIGATGDDQNGAGSGAAYVFERTKERWVMKQKLTPKDAQKKDYFGVSVAVAGDVVLVGNHGKAAYVFRNKGGTWGEDVRLPAPEPAADRFGADCAIGGTTLFVGAPGEQGKTAGAVYVYEKP